MSWSPFSHLCSQQYLQIVDAQKIFVKYIDKLINQYFLHVSHFFLINFMSCFHHFFLWVMFLKHMFFHFMIPLVCSIPINLHCYHCFLKFYDHVFPFHSVSSLMSNLPVCACLPLTMSLCYWKQRFSNILLSILWKRHCKEEWLFLILQIDCLLLNCWSISHPKDFLLCASSRRRSVLTQSCALRWVLWRKSVFLWKNLLGGEKGRRGIFYSL